MQRSCDLRLAEGPTIEQDARRAISRTVTRASSPRFALSAVLFAVTLSVVAGIGATRLFDPFSGDQALFFEGAKTLHAGGVLYRDYWDIKQPGIFIFFLIAGNVFGFSQVGMHELELIWQLIFAVVLVVALRPAFKNSRCVYLAPLTVVGAEYAGSSPWHLLQVEELVGLPLFIAIWMMTAERRTSRMSNAAALTSGLAAGIVLLFKLLFAPVLLVPAAVAYSKTKAEFSAGITRSWGICVLGVLIPLASYLLYSALTQTLRLALETAITTPLQIATYAPHAPLSRLVDSAFRLVLYFRGIIVLAIVGACTMRGEEQRQWRDLCVTWIVCGLAVIVLQIQSWWQYHFLLVAPPLGILAAFGVLFLVKRVRDCGLPRLIALAASGVVAYIAVPLPQGAIGTFMEVARQRPFSSRTALEAYRSSMSLEYASLLRGPEPPSVARPSASIYVFGNPLVYVLSRKTQPVSMTNWSSYLDPPFLWTRLDDELSLVRPDVIYVAGDRTNDVSSTRLPKMSAILVKSYVLKLKTARGTWYQRLDRK